MVGLNEELERSPGHAAACPYTARPSTRGHDRHHPGQACVPEHAIVSLRDASQLDGYGHLAFLWRVAIPVTRPVIASFAVISFLSAWNQYTWPRAVVTESDWETIQIGLKSLSTATVDQSNVALAAAIIAALPVLALLIFLQRHLIRGLTAGAVKG